MEQGRRGRQGCHVHQHLGTWAPSALGSISSDEPYVISEWGCPSNLQLGLGFGRWPWCHRASITLGGSLYNDLWTISIYRVPCTMYWCTVYYEPCNTCQGARVIFWFLWSSGSKALVNFALCFVLWPAVLTGLMCVSLVSLQRVDPPLEGWIASSSTPPSVSWRHPCPPPSAVLQHSFCHLSAPRKLRRGSPGST